MGATMLVTSATADAKEQHAVVFGMFAPKATALPFSVADGGVEGLALNMVVKRKALTNVDPDGTERLIEQACEVDPHPSWVYATFPLYVRNVVRLAFAAVGQNSTAAASDETKRSVKTLELIFPIRFFPPRLDVPVLNARIWT